MKFHLITAVLAAALLTGCPKKDPKGEKARKDNIKDQSADVTFQSFVGYVKQAVQRRDKEMLASLMVPNFGYTWDAPTPGENVFNYWDKNNLWPDLLAVVSERWTPYGDFMVAPAEFARHEAAYTGYRAGVKQFNGSWRFVYFVPPEPATPPLGPEPQ